METHVRRFFTTWAWLCLMIASTVSAIPLSKFQPITATTISLGCILAYNAEIPGCSINDFVAGNTCSASCVKGLKRVEANLQSACDRAEVSEISVLGQALLGNLVELLCSGTSSENPVSSPTAAPTTLTTRRIESTPPLTFTPVRPSSTTTTAVTETEEPETSTPTSRAPPTTTTPQTFIQSSPPTSSSSSSSTSTPEPPAEDSGRTSGGGSPFDVVSSGSGSVTICWVQAVVVGLGMGLLFLR